MEQYIGDYGVAIALIIGAVLIVRAVRDGVIRFAEVWRDATKARAEADTKIAEALEKVSATANAASERAEEAKTLIGGARREQQAIIATLNDANSGLGALADKLDQMPMLTAQKLRDELRDMLEGVRKGVVSMAQQLDTVCNRLDNWQPVAVAAGAAQEPTEAKPDPEPPTGAPGVDLPKAQEA